MRLNRDIEKQVLALVLIAELGRATLLAQAFTVLRSFIPELGDSHAGLVLSGSTLYGTAAVGLGFRPSPVGTVFKVNTDGTGFVTLHIFSANVGGVGGCPEGCLIVSGGTLYGTSKYGDGMGNVFSMDTAGNNFVPVHSFTGASDGRYPMAGLVLSSNTLYGTTAGEYGDGTVFKVNTDGTQFTTLHTFTGGSDGNGSVSTPVLSVSTLYGTASGGTYGDGTVFKVNTDGTQFTTLYSFTGGSDGNDPGGDLLLSGSTLYGTTARGGGYGNGTVFMVNTDGTGFTTLYSFRGGSDGADPIAGMILADGALYGTTMGGGFGEGTVFEIFTDGTGFQTLHTFAPTNYSAYYGTYTNSDGAFPQGRLLLSGNTLYGTTAAEGPGGGGTVFALTLPTPSISWVWPDAITYGTALGSAQLDAKANYPGVFAYRPPAGTVLQAGTNILSAVFTPTDPTDYPASINVQIAVSRAPLTVTAGNALRQYGQTNPVLTGTVTGVVNGDIITANYTCSATPASPPGNYPIAAGLVDPNNRLSNYSVTTNNGILTVVISFPTVEYEFQADFDGRDWLVIQGATARWQHFDFTPVGLHNPSYPATVISSSVNGVALLSGASWIPTWPNGTGSGAWSLTYGGLIPALPPNPAWVNLNVVSGRGSVSIVQLPNAANTNTLIVEFNDDAIAGDALYDAQIYVATESPLVVPAWRNGRVVLTWSAAPGQGYRVQYKDNLSQTAWLDLGNPITATNVTAASSDVTTNRARFYRVRLYP
jgi:uncharacterized repeat protein (TIGR03803 family)